MRRNVTINGFEKSWCGSDKGIVVGQATTDKFKVKIFGGKHDQEIFVLHATALTKEEQ